LAKSETALSKFIADLSQPLKVMDGSRNGCAMQLDLQSGLLVSGTFRKRGGFAGFVQKHMKYIATILDGLSLVTNLAPGLGTAISASAQLLKNGLTYAATGTLKLGTLISSGARFLGGAFSQTFGFLNT
jgi:hypothetical protein